MLPLPDQARLGGTFLGPDAYAILVDEPCEVFKPDGTLLLVLCRDVLPLALCQQGYQALRTAATAHGNRGMAAGVFAGVPGDTIRTGRDDMPLDTPNYRRTVGSRTTLRYKSLKHDGTLSNTNYAKNVPSGIVGYFERVARFPYCRQTAFCLEHPQVFAQALPLLQRIDQVFAETVPARYAAQQAMIARTHPDFYIHGTSFTTITVNKNWQTAVHKDAGDLKAGFGVLTALRAGKFDGCYFTFPAYRVAVNMRTGDVLLCDVHEWHGNTPLVGVPGTFERLSLVCYYREKMVHCGSAQAELDRAKRKQRGQPLFDRAEHV